MTSCLVVNWSSVNPTWAVSLQVMTATLVRFVPTSSRLTASITNCFMYRQRSGCTVPAEWSTNARSITPLQSVQSQKQIMPSVFTELSVGPFHRPRPNPTHCQVNLWTRDPTQAISNPTPIERRCSDAPNCKFSQSRTILLLPNAKLHTYVVMYTTSVFRKSAISDPWPNPTQPMGQPNPWTTLVCNAQYPLDTFPRSFPNSSTRTQQTCCQLVPDLWATRRSNYLDMFCRRTGTSNFVRCTFLVSIGTKAHYKFRDK